MVKHVADIPNIVVETLEADEACPENTFQMLNLCLFFQSEFILDLRTTLQHLNRIRVKRSKSLVYEVDNDLSDKNTTFVDEVVTRSRNGVQCCNRVNFLPK